jgi:Amt family ammonium transporter
MILGTFIIWFGFYGLNGSFVTTVSGKNTDIIGRIAVNTSVSGIFASLVSFTIHYFSNFRKKKYNNIHSSKAFCNGLLGGLVAASSVSHNIETWGAVIIGLVAGLAY